MIPVDLATPAAPPQPVEIPVERLAGRLRTLERLVQTSETLLDDDGHGQRVGELAAMLAKRLGLPDDVVHLLRHAAPLHDIGTIGIPEKLLLKPGKLTEDEFDQVKEHVGIGARMLSFGNSKVVALARVICLAHHERFDGSGYPEGLRGDAIPLAGQIVALADFFDTLTHPRPYRRAWSVEEAIGKIRRRSGTEFNPRLVTVFMRVLAEQEERHRAPVAPGQGIQLKGSIDIDTFYDLLVSLTQNSRSGKLSIFVGLAEAVLVVREGSLIHAEFDGVEGEDAVLALLSKAGRYPRMEFLLKPLELGAAPSRVTVKIPTQQLLLETTVALDHDRAS